MTRTIFIAAALALAVTLPAAPANAQTAIRTYVSITGNDTNPCSLTAPCRHFQAAANATAAGGEVDALDPGGYGSLIISQAITIQGQGWSYVAPPNGEPAISINAVSGNVNIDGVLLNGVGTTGSTGIAFSSGSSLTVRNSVIRNFSTNGIFVDPLTSNLTQVFVSNTLVSDNGSNGILIAPNGTGTTNGVFEHVEVENNAADGLEFLTDTQVINATVSDCVSASNSVGINATANGETAVSVMVRNSTIANNATIGLQAMASGTIRVTRSTITGNMTAWAAVLPSVVSSYDDNNIDGNGGGSPSANTAPPTTGYK
jgi:hypothetical protein